MLGLDKIIAEKKLSLPLVLRLTISLLLLVRPLASCSSENDREPQIKATAVPSPLAPKKLDKKGDLKNEKKKVVSFRKNEPVLI